jgi:hypothetical protein
VSTEHWPFGSEYKEKKMSNIKDRYLEKHYSQHNELMVIALAGIIDGLSCLLTLGRYETRFRHTVLFYSDEETATDMLKQMLKGCKGDD